MADSVIQGVVGKLVEFSAVVPKKQANYLCCYSCNVQTLAHEVVQQKTRYDSQKLVVDRDRANCRDITPEVEAWFQKVKELINRIDKILGDAEKIRSSVRKWFPLLYYSLSRKASNIVKNSVELRNTTFDIISIDRIPAELPPVTTSNVGFASRNGKEKEIMDAWKDSSVYAIVIWGIAGVAIQVSH